jgi:hypothetical protein
MRKNLEEEKTLLLMETLTIIDGNIKKSTMLCKNTQMLTLYSTQHQLPVNIDFFSLFLSCIKCLYCISDSLAEECRKIWVLPHPLP